MTVDGQSVGREHLLTGAFGAAIDRIEAHRITLPPGQVVGRHSHVGGVVGVVLEGAVLFEVDGQEATTLYGGDVFYEPPGATINHFDNASDSAPVVFLAFYPLSGDQPLLTMV